MPIYEFSCQKCNSNFETFVISHKNINSVQCPKCGSKKVQKVVSAFNCGCSSGGSLSFGGSSGCGGGSTRFG